MYKVKSASGGNELITVYAIYMGDSASGLAFKAALLEEASRKEVARVWLPHSQVKSLAGSKVAAVFGDSIVIDIPVWLAERNNFDSYFKQQLLDLEYGQEEDEEGGEDDVPF